MAGLGDLIATCESNLSRNHYVGVELTKGHALKDIIKSMNCVAEGVTTTKVTYRLAQEMELEMPITERIYQVLYKGADPRKTTTGLMSVAASHELAGRKWKLFSLFRRRRKKIIN